MEFHAAHETALSQGQYYLPDALGSVRQVVDAQEQVGI